MSALYPSLSERRQANAIARRFTIDAVAGRRAEAQRFLASGIEMIERGMECGADPAFLLDTARGLSDAVSNIVGGMRRDLDNVGADERDAEIDMAELDALIGRLS